MGEQLGESTRSKAIDSSCWFTQQMLRNLEHAVEHEDMTEELAEILSTTNVDVCYQIDRGVDID